MLTSIKLDKDIYVEPNERTYELVANGYIPPDDIEKRIERIKKEDTVPVQKLNYHVSERILPIVSKIGHMHSLT